MFIYIKSRTFPHISVASIFKFTLHRTLHHPVMLMLPYSNGNCGTRCLQELFSAIGHTVPFMFVEWSLTIHGLHNFRKATAV